MAIDLGVAAAESGERLRQLGFDSRVRGVNCIDWVRCDEYLADAKGRCLNYENCPGKGQDRGE